MQNVTRRTFLVHTALGAGVVAVGPVMAANTPSTVFAFSPRKAVNPAIDNLRVVCGVNPAMITADPLSWDMSPQNDPVDTAQVEKTLDAMALSLTGAPGAPQAWKAILRKPEGKEWKKVRAAIKVNCIAKNHPRIAVVNKVCTELNRLGVAYPNIVIYDGTHNALPLYGSFVGNGLPKGVVVSDKHRELGGTIEVATPDPNPGSYQCSKAIADGSIDILINIAVNKGHDEKLGKTTLTLKNHAGTFEPRPIHSGGGLDYILALNKSDAFWGGGVVRQQLCIVDSLWGSVDGPFAAPDNRLNRLVMGTFAGAVDYLTAKKIREPLLKASHKHIERFVTDFGYKEEDLGDLITVTV